MTSEKVVLTFFKSFWTKGGKGGKFELPIQQIFQGLNSESDLTQT